MEFRRSWGLSLLGFTLSCAPVCAQTLEDVAPLLEQVDKLKETDGDGARARLQQALDLLDRLDAGCTSADAWHPRWLCGLRAWEFDDAQGLRAWDGVIAYYTKGGKSLPAEPQELGYCQQARSNKATILETRHKRADGSHTSAEQAAAQKQKDYDEAIALRRVIVDDWIQAKDTGAAAEARAEQGQAMVQSGDSDKGLDGLRLLEQACNDLRREQPGSPALARVAQMFATTLNDMGQSLDRRRLECVHEALEILRRQPQDDVASLVRLQWETANALFVHMRYPEARALAAEALDLALAKLPKDHQETRWARGFYSEVLKAMGDNKGAVELLDTNIEFVKRLDKPVGFDQMFWWNKYGNVLLLEKRWDDAIAALENGRKAIDPAARTPIELSNRSYIFINLAVCYGESGHTAEGLQMLEEALKLTNEQDRYWLEGAKAMVLQRHGKFEDAAKLFDDAVPKVLRLGGQHRKSVDHLHRQAMTLAALQQADPKSDRKRLVDCLDQALAQADRMVDECYALPGRPSYELATLVDDAAQVALSLVDSVPKDQKARLEQHAFELLESLRGIELRVTSLGARIARQQPKDREAVQQQRERAFAARQALSELTASSQATVEEVVDKALEKERREFAQLTLALRGVDKSMVPERITVDAIAAAVPKNAAAVAFRLVTLTRPDSETKGKTEARTEQFEAHVVTRGADQKGGFQRIQLGKATEVRPAIQKWLDAIQGGEKRGRTTKVVAGDPGGALAKLVFDKVKQALPKGVKSLVVCLDDDLHRIPLEILPGAMDFEFRFAVSLVDLLADQPAVPATGTLCAIGGLDFDKLPGAEPAAEGPLANASAAAASRGAAMEFRGGGDDDMGIPQVRSLENAGAEVEKIAGLFKQQQQQRDQVVLTGLEATRKRVFTEIQQAGYLHFATHGYSVVFGRGADNRQRAAAVAAFAPMAMCGLTLSGSNNTGKNGFVGVITAEEIAGLDLSGCQLAVLSACSTYLGGEGQGRAGHGFASLQGALHAAGVRWVITTRWDVNDAAAMKLMERFYTELWKNPGIHPRTALDRAQEQMRKDRPVNDWAGFILTGDLKD